LGGFDAEKIRDLLVRKRIFCVLDPVRESPTLVGMNRWSKAVLGLMALCCTVSNASAQLGVNIRMNQSQYLAGEAMLVTVTITNHTGTDILLANQGRTPWLDMVVKKANGQPATSLGRANFGGVKIAAGQSMSKTIDVAGMYHLREPGTYSVSALVRSAGAETGGFISNRLLFNCANVRPDWSQKVGVPGQPGKVHEFRVINFTNSRRSLLYTQVIDSKTGISLQTLNLGEALLFRKPQAAVDRTQTLHVLYLATPELYVHARVDVQGRFVGRELHKRGGGGDPKLMSFADGSVKVAGSILYDAKAAAAERSRIRKISERPPYTYN
jgi:hypothetical protein